MPAIWTVDELRVLALWRQARRALAGPGKTVVVVDDGAVGLLAMLSAKQMGAERIITMGRHPKRQQLAREEIPDPPKDAKTVPRRVSS